MHSFGAKPCTSPAEMQETWLSKGKNALFLSLVFTSLSLVCAMGTKVARFFNKRFANYIGIIGTKGTENVKENITGFICKVHFE